MNQNRIESLVKSSILFVSFLIVGILLPFWMFNLDPFAILAYFLILAPICYSILGIISAFFFHKISYLLLNGIIAQIPMFLFYHFYMSIEFGFWIILYLVIFCLCFFVIRLFKNKKPDNKQINTLITIFRYLLIITGFAYIIISIVQIIVNIRNYGSSPWYESWIINAFIFIIQLVIELSFLLFYSKSKNNNKKNIENQ